MINKIYIDEFTGLVDKQRYLSQMKKLRYAVVVFGVSIEILAFVFSGNVLMSELIFNIVSTSMGTPFYLVALLWVPSKLITRSNDFEKEIQMQKAACYLLLIPPLSFLYLILRINPLLFLSPIIQYPLIIIIAFFIFAPFPWRYLRWMGFNTDLARWWRGTSTKLVAVGTLNGIFMLLAYHVKAYDMAVIFLLTHLILITFSLNQSRIRGMEIITIVAGSFGLALPITIFKIINETGNMIIPYLIFATFLVVLIFLTLITMKSVIEVRVIVMCMKRIRHNRERWAKFHTKYEMGMFKAAIPLFLVFLYLSALGVVIEDFLGCIFLLLILPWIVSALVGFLVSIEYQIVDALGTRGSLKNDTEWFLPGRWSRCHN